jgi:hypothetical protein
MIFISPLSAVSAFLISGDCLMVGLPLTVYVSFFIGKG